MDGILIVDKPQGMTSHDVVDFLRRRFNLKKVGHAGTLDPMATGVLVMLLGSSTRASNTLMGDDKEYEGAMTLGAVSDTADAWGVVSPTGKAVSYTRAEIESAFLRFTGAIEQRPPMYAAVKVNGRKLYELARKGVVVDVAARPVVIRKLAVTSVDLPRVSFSVTCSKGTYVRQLAVDIGALLGCGAHLSALRRTRSGAFTVDRAVTVDALRGMDAARLALHLTQPVSSSGKATPS